MWLEVSLHAQVPSAFQLFLLLAVPLNSLCGLALIAFRRLAFGGAHVVLFNLVLHPLFPKNQCLDSEAHSGSCLFRCFDKNTIWVSRRHIISVFSPLNDSSYECPTLRLTHSLEDAQGQFPDSIILFSFINWRNFIRRCLPSSTIWLLTGPACREKAGYRLRLSFSRQ